MGVLIFNACFISACLLDIIAALKVWRWLTIPYILLEGCRLCAVLSAHIITMMIYKKQLNLGVLIAASCIGGFFILFLAYMWSCSIALFQVVGFTNSKEYKKMMALNAAQPMKSEKFQKNISVSSIQVNNFKKSPIGSKNDKLNGIFISDFSEFYRKPPRM